MYSKTYEFKRTSKFDKNYSQGTSKNDIILGDYFEIESKDKSNKLIMTTKLYSDSSEVIRESELLNKRLLLNHPHLFNLLDYNVEVKRSFCSTMYEVRAFFELPKKSLRKNLIDRKSRNPKVYFSVKEYSFLFYHLVMACSYLQQNSIHHSDINPNLIFGEKGHYKICLKQGPGATSYRAQCEKFMKNDMLYVSPLVYAAVKVNRLETLKHNSFKSDTFSLGLVLLEAATLQSIQGIYMENRRIDFDKISILLEEAKKRYFECNVLITSLGRMLEGDEDRRTDFIYLNNNLPSYQKIVEYYQSKQGMNSELSIVDSFDVSKSLNVSKREGSVSFSMNRGQRESDIVYSSVVSSDNKDFQILENRDSNMVNVYSNQRIGNQIDPRRDGGPRAKNSIHSIFSDKEQQKTENLPIKSDGNSVFLKTNQGFFNVNTDFLNNQNSSDKNRANTILVHKEPIKTQGTMIESKGQMSFPVVPFKSTIVPTYHQSVIVRSDIKSTKNSIIDQQVSNTNFFNDVKMTIDRPKDLKISRQSKGNEFVLPILPQTKPSFDKVNSPFSQVSIERNKQNPQILYQANQNQQTNVYYSNVGSLQSIAQQKPEHNSINYRRSINYSIRDSSQPKDVSDSQLIKNIYSDNSVIIEKANRRFMNTSQNRLPTENWANNSNIVRNTIINSNSQVLKVPQKIPEKEAFRSYSNSSSLPIQSLKKTNNFFDFRQN